MDYILIEFAPSNDLDSKTQCYQEINNGILVRYCDVDTGETIILPEPNEARVIDAKPPKPTWAE